MKFKQYDASFKALPAEDGRQVGAFSAIVAVFDNVDSAGDRLKSTAFDATLKAWRDSGDPIPVILSHKWDDPFAIVGHADPNKVKAIPGRGLYVEGQLHVGRGNEVADQVYRLMSERILREWSFGYTVPPGGEKKSADGAYDLSAVSLIEFGPCLKGVNDQTELLAVKSMMAVDAPRVDDPAETDPDDVTSIVAGTVTASLINADDVVVASITADAVTAATLGDPTDPPADTPDPDPEKHTDVLVYEAAIENLESQLGVGFDDDALETARLDADIDAQLGA